MKRVLCFLIILSLLIPAFSVTSCAYNGRRIEINEFISDYDRFGEEKPLISDNAESYYYCFSTGKTDYTTYSLLDGCQRKMYDYIVNSTPGQLSITFNFDYGEFDAENFTQDYLSDVMYAVLRERPEIFYFNGYQVTGGYYYGDGTCIAVLNFVISVKSTTTYNANNLPGYCTALKNALENVPVDLSNRYNFVKSVHDYLCNFAYYPDLNSSDYIGNAHDAYGALVEGRTVCEGYSEAFKLICNYYNIPSVCITGDAGGPHMWNAVQMDDGNWYLLDITWDDQDSYGIYYDFFLVGLNTKDRYFTGYEFGISHVSDGSPYLPVLNYATDKYTETNHNTAFEATYNSLAIDDGNYLIRSYFDIDETNVYYNGMYVETDNLTTNGVFKAPSGENYNPEDWTLVVLGDCNADGNCNVADYSDAVNKVLADNGVSDATDMAADMDCDGSLDVIDLAVIQLATSGLDTDIEIE